MPFSNGTEYSLFQHNVCEKCIHWTYTEGWDSWGCPLMDVFMLYYYGAKGKHLEMIDTLCNGKDCQMFKPIGALGQKRL